MICRAKGCPNWAMPMNAENPKGLCGKCHEDDEEYPVRLKSGPKEMSPEALARRSATRKRNIEERDAKRAELRERIGLPPLKGAA